MARKEGKRALTRRSFRELVMDFQRPVILRMRERNEHTPSPDLPILQSASATCGCRQMSVLPACIPNGLALYCASRARCDAVTYTPWPVPPRNHSVCQETTDDQDQITLSKNAKRAETRLRVSIDLLSQDTEHDRLREQVYLPGMEPAHRRLHTRPLPHPGGCGDSPGTRRV